MDTGIAIFAEINFNDLISLKFKVGEKKSESLPVAVFRSEKESPFAHGTQSGGMGVSHIVGNKLVAAVFAAQQGCCFKA